MKPVINLDELTFETDPDDPEAGRWGVISDHIGAKALGYNLTVLAPGKKACPFHNHHINEEMFFIVSGEGLLRFGKDEYPLRTHDVIACPAGGREVAHQIINTGKTELVYLSLSQRTGADICEYPDSNKTGVYVGSYTESRLRQMFRAETTVPYGDREPS